MNFFHSIFKAVRNFIEGQLSITIQYNVMGTMTDEESKFSHINVNKILNLHNYEPQSLTVAHPMTLESMKYLSEALMAENGTKELQTRAIFKNTL